MPSVPSEIVDYLDNRHPEAKQAEPSFKVFIGHGPVVAVVLEMVESIPQRLLMPLRGDDHAEFREAVSALRTAVGRWNAGDKNYVLGAIPGRKRLNPLSLLRRQLAQLRDEGAELSTNELAFIDDPDFREQLRRDLGSMDRSLANGEWKAATVLGGSIAEALLLDSLKQHKGSPFSAEIAALVSASTLDRKPHKELDRWDLHELTAVALEVSVIDQETAAQCRIARKFRNLIHPGRVLRLQIECDRGTALSAVAAVEHVIRDLT